MGTTTGQEAASLFGKTRRAILTLLFVGPQEAYYVREIIRTIGNQGAVQRELANLTSAGIIERFQQGNQVYYQANKASPVFPEIRSLMVKTCGVAHLLREALSPLGAKIKAAWIYGSFASGEQGPESDIDLMIVGSLRLADAVAAVQDAQDTLGREVNPFVFSSAEFRRKLESGHHFVNAVADGPKLMVVGDESDFGRLGKERLAKKPTAKRTRDL
ncbi:MAG: nucleotidyltransferase domain-containing protein [Candidatus Geothermincolia bacterium]